MLSRVVDASQRGCPNQRARIPFGIQGASHLVVVGIIGNQRPRTQISSHVYPTLSMLIFLDTEFTDFVQIDLISVALVSEDGHEFYAERTDYRREDCTDFVLAAVLPLLGRIPGAACTRGQLTQRLRTWLEALPEPATLVFDYFSDWELLVDAILGDDGDKLPVSIGGKQLLAADIVSDSVFQNALNRTFTREWPPHHALADARAIRAGYRAWQQANTET